MKVRWKNGSDRNGMREKGERRKGYGRVEE
jgi:hypothetical protein